MIEINLNSFSGPVVVSAAYFILWYYLLFIVQRGTKYRLLEKYKAQGKEFDRYFSQDNEMLAADRVVINTQEQMVPFLASLWLHSILVSPVYATYLGALYILLRSIYPLLMGKSVSKVQSKKVYFVTLPGYLIIFYMIGSSVWIVLS